MKKKQFTILALVLVVIVVVAALILNSNRPISQRHLLLMEIIGRPRSLMEVPYGWNLIITAKNGRLYRNQRLS